MIRNPRFRIKSASVILSIAIFVIGVALLNFIAAARGSYHQSASLPRPLIYLDLFIIFSIIGFFILKLLRFLISKRHDAFSYKFHKKLILTFSILGIAPVACILIFSIIFFNFTSKAWFSNILDTGFGESLDISNIYIEEHRQNIINDLFRIKKLTEKQAGLVMTNQGEFDSILSGQAANLSLTEAMVFVYNKSAKSAKLLAKTPFSFSSIDKFDFAKNYKPNELGYSVIINDEDSYIRAITKINTMPNSYVMVGRSLNDKIIRHAKNAQASASDYQDLRSKIISVQSQFIWVFVLIVLLMISVLIVISINYASRIFIPIFDMMLATRQIAQGEYNLCLNENIIQSEMVILTKSFNQMVRLIREGDLNLNSQIINAKKEFLEKILGNLPTAILVLDVEKKVKLFNKSAKRIFARKNLSNLEISFLLPEIDQIFDELNLAQDETFYAVTTHLGQKLHLLIAIESDEGEIKNYVINLFQI